LRDVLEVLLFGRLWSGVFIRVSQEADEDAREILVQRFANGIGFEGGPPAHDTMSGSVGQRTQKIHLLLNHPITESSS
jgi:hypothetical protein